MNIKTFFPLRALTIDILIIKIIDETVVIRRQTIFKMVYIGKTASIMSIYLDILHVLLEYYIGLNMLHLCHIYIPC